MLALLPDLWFAGYESQLPLILIATTAMVLVIKGADWLVDGAAGIARRLGMSTVIIGATVVALGTTTPEAAVSVLAAWQGESGLALGNGVGSIIADTGLIFGIGCMLTRLPADRFVLTRQGWVQFGAGTMLAAICFTLYVIDRNGAELGRWVGVLFTSLLVLYMVISVRWSRQCPHGEPRIVADADGQERIKPAAVLVLYGLLGLALVVFAADTLVKSVSVLAEDHWRVPQAVVAATMIAFGTSVPELFVGISAIRKGHPELLVGNVIGADVLNVLFVIGAAALAAPLPIIEKGTAQPAILLQLHLPMMLLMLVLFRLYITRAVKVGSFSRWMGGPLVVSYSVFVVLAFWLSR